MAVPPSAYLTPLWRRLLSYSIPGMRLPPSASRGERVLYGLAQPVLGLRMLASDRTLLVESLKPALLLAGFCALAALLHLHIGDEHSSGDVLREHGFWHRFYTAFAVLAPLPSILLAPHYCQLAATAHDRLCLGTCKARRGSFVHSLIHALKQAAVVAIAVAPLLGILGWLPLFGQALAAIVGALWALHWVVVEAFDSARVVQVSTATVQTPAGSAGEASSIPETWFVRALVHAADRLPVVGIPLRWFASLCRFLSRPWQEEIALAESYPWFVVGFALMTAALLATPVLNLLFRPIIIIASVHLLARLPRADAADSAMVTG